MKGADRRKLIDTTNRIPNKAALMKRSLDEESNSDNERNKPSKPINNKKPLPQRRPEVKKMVNRDENSESDSEFNSSSNSVDEREKRGVQAKPQ